MRCSNGTSDHAFLYMQLQIAQKIGKALYVLPGAASVRLQAMLAQMISL